jgi:hypothetical protein
MWVITTTKTTKYDERGRVIEVVEIKEEKDVPIQCHSCSKNKPEPKGEPKFGTVKGY